MTTENLADQIVVEAMAKLQGKMVGPETRDAISTLINVLLGTAHFVDETLAAADGDPELAAWVAANRIRRLCKITSEGFGLPS